MNTTIETLLSINLDALSPMEAFTALSKLQRQARAERDAANEPATATVRPTDTYAGFCRVLEQCMEYTLRRVSRLDGVVSETLAVREAERNTPQGTTVQKAAIYEHALSSMRAELSIACADFGNAVYQAYIEHRAATPDVEPGV